MLKNFFLVAIRTIVRNPLYSLLNIVGLSVGIACSLLILLWVRNEITFDKHFSNYSNVNQLYINAEFDNKIKSRRSVPLPAYQALKNYHSTIKNVTVSDWGFNDLLVYENKKLMQDGYFVGHEFLEVFPFKLKLGETKTVFENPNSIVITEALATKLFGNDDPLGKLIKFRDEHSVQVTGVLYDLPFNSSIRFDYLLGYEFWKQIQTWVGENEKNWGNNSFQVYVELYDGKTLEETNQNIRDFIIKNDPPEDNYIRLAFLHPMEKWRLYSEFKNGVAAGGLIDFVRLFAAIAFLIILIACINFMNLSTARSEKRAREVGIRKSMGSTRSKIIFQFLGESLVITVIAFAFALILAQSLLPFFNVLVDKKLVIPYSSKDFIIGSIFLIAFVGVIAGSYPAFYLSAFSPVKTLKGSIKAGKNATSPRKVLVVTQFVISIFLLISTAVIYMQINLVKNRKLGYNQDNLIAIDITSDISDHYEIIKRELLETGAVTGVTKSNGKITQINSNNFLSWPGQNTNQQVIFTTIVADYDYCQTMGISLLEGREFSKDFALDSNAILVNKAALDLMQLPEPIGTSLDLWGDKRKLIGVTENVLMGSLFENINPCFIILGDWGGYMSIRLNGSFGLEKSLKEVEKVLSKHNPSYPFEYKFADDDFQEKFTYIRLTQRLAILFAILSLVITGLGLFGLAAFMAEQRIKEIGIRKVLGANFSQILTLMSREFSWLILIAFGICTPITWFLLNEYLKKYPLRVNVSFWIFPLVGLAVWLFTFLIVWQQTQKAAKMNPSDALRYE